MTPKTIKAVYWTTTVIIFLMEGVMPALTGHTELAKEGIRHLGYPDYFRVFLNVFKVAGALALVLPFVPDRIKEWAYFGFAVSMIAAFVSHLAVDGFSGMAVMPLAFLGVLIGSYTTYHRLRELRGREKVAFDTDRPVFSGAGR